MGSSYRSFVKSCKKICILRVSPYIPAPTVALPSCIVTSLQNLLKEKNTIITLYHTVEDSKLKHSMFLFVYAILALLAVYVSANASNKVTVTKNVDKSKKVACNEGKNKCNLIQSFFTEFSSTVVNAKDHLIAGATARGVSIFLLYPLDTIKTRLQMSPSVRATMAPISSLSLFKGVFGSLAGQIPYGMLTFGSYEVYKSKLLTAFPSARPEAMFMLSAILGDLTGSFWLCPSEVIKQQMQGGMHDNLFSAFASTWKNSGIKGFYRGYAGQIMRDVPFRAIQLPSYEIVKSTYSKQFATNADGTTRTLKPVENMLVGAIAGSFSAAITTPLDVVKTRLMTDKTIATISFSNAFKAATNLAKTEGISGLFSGLGPRVVYVGPSCGLFFVVYEATKVHLAGKKQSVMTNK
jgi:solute carrier family 25 S-adenosylmethionine transporter 26